MGIRQSVGLQPLSRVRGAKLETDGHLVLVLQFVHQVDEVIGGVNPRQPGMDDRILAGLEAIDLPHFLVHHGRLGGLRRGGLRPLAHLNLNGVRLGQDLAPVLRAVRPAASVVLYDQVACSLPLLRQVGLAGVGGVPMRLAPMARATLAW